MYFNANIAYGMLFHEDSFPIYVISHTHPLAQHVFQKDNPGTSKKNFPSYSEMRSMEEGFPIQLIKLYDAEHHERHFVVMALKGNIARSDGEFAVSVRKETFQVDSNLLQEAKQFCQKYELPAFEPEWLLFS